MSQPYKVSTQENSDNLRNEAYTLIQQAFNVPEGFANFTLNRLVDCIISVAVLQVAALQEKAAQQTLALDVCPSTADGLHLWRKDSNGKYCFACGKRQ